MARDATENALAVATIVPVVEQPAATAAIGIIAPEAAIGIRVDTDKAMVEVGATVTRVRVILTILIIATITFMRADITKITIQIDTMIIISFVIMLILI